MVEEIRIQNFTKESFIDLLDQVIENKLNSFFLDKEEEKLTVKRIAHELGYSELTIHNWRKSGILKSKKIGRRVYILRKDLNSALTEVKSLKYKRD